jgi:hypothetical protein
MITFVDGPAMGQTLSLRRAPLLLRVTHIPHTGKFDALDQPEDVPTPRERIYVYVLTGIPTHYHMRCRRRSESGFFYDGSYRVLETQPAEEDLRDTHAWRNWALAWYRQNMPDRARGQKW